MHSWTDSLLRSWLLLTPLLAASLTAGCGGIVETCDEDTDAAFPHHGLVNVAQFPAGPEPDSGEFAILTAHFWDEEALPSGRVKCVVQEEAGSCRLEQCDISGLYDFVAGENAAIDGGPVSAPGGVVSEAIGGIYHDAGGMAYDPGSQVELRVTGNDVVPSMVAVMEVPPLPVITAPSNDVIAHPRNEDLVVAWEKIAGAGTVEVALSTEPDVNEKINAQLRPQFRYHVICEAEVDDGAVTIASSLLEAFPETDLDPALSARVRDTQTIEDDGWEVKFAVGCYAQAPGGGQFDRPLKLD